MRFGINVCWKFRLLLFDSFHSLSFQYLPHHFCSFGRDSSSSFLLLPVSIPSVTFQTWLIICCRMKAWTDLTLMSLTFLLSIIWNIEVGVVVSLVISLFMVVHRSSKTRMNILVWRWSFLYMPCLSLSQGRIPGTDRWKPLKENPEAEESMAGALIVRIRENLDFGRPLL